MTFTHVTNGDSTVETLRAAGFQEPIIPWRDVLHDGPVPAEVSRNELNAFRARFIADAGWAPYDDVLRGFEARDLDLDEAACRGELVLWFEHDLYDQLQLLQILDRLSDRGVAPERLSLICIDRHAAVERFLGLGQLSGTQLKELYPQRRTVSRAQLEIARDAWAAFRASDPSSLAELTRRDPLPLPFVGDALRRYLREYPSTANGLGQTQQRTLDVLSTMECDPVELFQAVQDRETAPFLGDSVFWWHITTLIAAPVPLVEVRGQTTLVPLEELGDVDAFREQRLRMTDAGWSVLDGSDDAVALNGIDRWLGGVHLHGTTVPWRWDDAGQQLAKRDAER